MKNQKIQNFFKTLFFKQNHGYSLTVLFFWLSIVMIVLDIGAKIIDLFFFPESLPFGGYLYNNISHADQIFSIRDLSLRNGSITEFFYLLLPFKFLDSTMINNGFIQKNCTFNFCSYAFTTTAKIIIYGCSLVLIFLINFAVVNTYIVLNKKRPTK